MAFVTQIVHTVSNIGVTANDRDYAYGTISTFSDTTIPDSDILVVSLNGVALTLTTHYTVDQVEEDIVLENTLTLAIDDSLVIERMTGIDTPLVDYTDNNTIGAGDLDKSALQALYKLQELTNESSNSITLDLPTDRWDGQGKATYNFASAVVSTGLTTLAQVQNLIAGTDTATVDDIARWSFTGDGSTTQYTLATPPTGLADVSQVMVSVDGLVQLPTTHYTLTVGATTIVTFTTAPANTAIIQVWTVQGIVSVTFPDGSIAGTALEDDAVGLDKINVGLGGALRGLIFDTSGDPTARVFVHTDISDFDAGVIANTLDTFAEPVASVDFSEEKLINVLAGTATTDGVNKGQMDAAITAAVPVAVNKALGGSVTISGLADVTAIALPGAAQMITFRHNPTLGGTTDTTIYSSDLPYTLTPSANTTWAAIISDTGAGITITTSPGSASGSALFEYGIITD